jgi:hypothetical protein
MLNHEAIENALVAWMIAATGIPSGRVVLADQNAPAPTSGLYATIRIGPITKVGTDQPGPVNESGIRTLYGIREFSVSINAFRDGARRAMEAAASSLDKEAHIQQLRAAGLTIRTATPVLNLTAPVEKTMREQRQMDVVFWAASEETEQVGVIQQVELEATTQQPPAPDDVETITIGEPYTP